MSSQVKTLTEAAGLPTDKPTSDHALAYQRTHAPSLIADETVTPLLGYSAPKPRPPDQRTPAGLHRKPRVRPRGHGNHPDRLAAARTPPMSNTRATAPLNPVNVTP